MARPNRIWFRKDIGWWMITLGGKKIRLAQGKENKKLAEQKFHELALLQARVPETPSARVADVIESFLAWAKPSSERRDASQLSLVRPAILRAFGVHSGFRVEADSPDPMDRHETVGPDYRTQCPAISSSRLFVGM